MKAAAKSYLKKVLAQHKCALLALVCSKNCLPSFLLDQVLSDLSLLPES